MNSFTSVTVQDPDRGSVVHGFGNSGPSGLGSPLPIYEQQPNGIIIDRIYSGACAVPNYGGLGNFFASAEMHSLGTQTAVTTYGYDRNGNVISKTEYDWIPASSVPRGSNNFVTGLPSILGTVKRTTTNTYFNGSAAATGCSTVIGDSNGYWNHQAPIASGSTLVTPMNELNTSAVLTTTC